MKHQEKQDYELLPHKEIVELKEELKRLKEFDLTPTKKMEISILDLNKKLDRLIEIFDHASHELRTEEGGLGFREKMRPVLEKMNRILEQNAEIASGILAVADLLKGESHEKPSMSRPPLPPPMGGNIMPPPRPRPSLPNPPQHQPQNQFPQRMPPRPGVNVRLPQQDKKRDFGF